MSDSSPEKQAGDSHSNDESRNKARRDILRTLVVGGGAMTAARATPETWVKPVVESVILPGHAATSAPAGGGAVNPFGIFSSGTISLTEVTVPADTRLVDATPEPESISDELLEFFMPSANAGVVIDVPKIPICNVACEVEFNAEVQNTISYICVSGNLPDFLKVPVHPGSPPIMGSALGHFFFLNGGEFRNGNWILDVRYTGGFVNASTVVRMSPGGIGCDR